MARVLVIPDLQAPFQNPRALEFLKDIYKAWQCDTVVCIGDECDFKFLKYANCNDPHSPEQQHTMALIFLRQLYEAFPNVMVCHSNHVKDRIDYASQFSGVPRFMMKNEQEITEAPPGWEWREHWIIDNVRYEHGHHIPGGKNGCLKQAINLRHCSVVLGHYPTMAVHHTVGSSTGKSLFSVCVGALTVPNIGLKTSYGMSYGKKYGEPLPQGATVVIDGQFPFIIPLVEG